MHIVGLYKSSTLTIRSKSDFAKIANAKCGMWVFPVRVDNAVFESPFDWATEIRHERNSGDFTRWKNHDDYEKAFARLLRDLKAEAITG